MASTGASGQKGHACHHCGTVPARHMMVVPNTEENRENAKACQMPHWNIAYDPEKLSLAEAPRQAEEELPPQQLSSEPTTFTPRSC